MQSLTDEEKRVLEVILSKGVARGRILRRLARIDDPKLFVQVVRGLQQHGFIEVSGQTDDAKAIQNAFFSSMPSTKSMASKALKEG